MELAPGGLMFSGWPGDSYLECLDVGDDILDLRGLEGFFERRHELIAILNPFLQILVGHFVAVHGEGAALGNSFQARTDFFLILIGVMAKRAFGLKNSFPAFNGSGGRFVVCGFFLFGFLRQRRSGHS